MCYCDLLCKQQAREIPCWCRMRTALRCRIPKPAISKPVNGLVPRNRLHLEELFRLACRYTGQAPSYDLLAQEAGLSLGDKVGTQRVRNYLRFLADTMLLHLIPPLEWRRKRLRGNPKLCLVDHGLRASWLQEQVPLVPEELEGSQELSTSAGYIAESTLGSTASAIPGLGLSHVPGRGTDLEVDFVFVVGDRRLPVEVKYQRRIDPVRDTRGIRSFVNKPANRASFEPTPSSKTILALSACHFRRSCCSPEHGAPLTGNL